MRVEIDQNFTCTRTSREFNVKGHALVTRQESVDSIHPIYSVAFFTEVGAPVFHSGPGVYHYIASVSAMRNIRRVLFSAEDSLIDATLNLPFLSIEEYAKLQDYHLGGNVLQVGPGDGSTEASRTLTMHDFLFEGKNVEVVHDDSEIGLDYSKETYSVCASPLVMRAVDEGLLSESDMVSICLASMANYCNPGPNQHLTYVDDTYGDILGRDTDDLRIVFRKDLSCFGVSSRLHVVDLDPFFVERSRERAETLSERIVENPDYRYRIPQLPISAMYLKKGHGPIINVIAYKYSFIKKGSLDNATAHHRLCPSEKPLYTLDPSLADLCMEARSWIEENKRRIINGYKVKRCMNDIMNNFHAFYKNDPSLWKHVSAFSFLLTE